MPDNKSKNIGIFQMLACACLWSIAGIFIKQIPWNPFVIAGWRSLIAAITVTGYMIIAKKPFRINKTVLINGLFEGLLFISFVASNKLTTSANAIVLQFTCPIFLMVYSSILFKKKFRRMDIIVAIVTLAGIALCFMDQLEGGHLLGNIVSVCAGALMAAMYLVIGNADPDDKFSGMLAGHVLAAAIGLPFMAFTSNTVTSLSVVSVIILGVFQLGVPYILYVLSTKTCPPLACSLIAAAEPLLNPVWVAIFDGEVPGPLALAGGIIVIGAVTIWCVLDGKKAAA